MPITPLHFGPGILIESVVPKKFSLVAFIWTQVFIDTETVWNIFSRQERLHSFFHSFLGSTISGMSISGILIFYYKIRKRNRIDLDSKNPVHFILIYSALIGGWSHVLLDSIMHADLRPFWPFSEKNQMLDIISLDWLHLFCVISGLFGGIIWIVKKLLKNYNARRP